MSDEYHSYLLRVWREASRIRPTWRFTLNTLSDDQLHGYATLDQVVDFVRVQMDEIAASEPDLSSESLAFPSDTRFA